MKKNKKFLSINNSSVKKQMLYTFLIATIIPILIVGSFLIAKVRNQMLTHYEEQLKAEGIRINSVLFDITTSMYTNSESIISTKSYMQMLGKSQYISASDSDYTSLNKDLSFLKKNSAAIAGFINRKRAESFY